MNLLWNNFLASFGKFVEATLTETFFYYSYPQIGYVAYISCEFLLQIFLKKLITEKKVYMTAAVPYWTDP